MFSPFVEVETNTSILWRNEETIVHSDIQNLDVAYTASRSDAQALIANLTEAQATWRPHPAAWCVAECLDHLALTNRIYLATMQPVAARRAPRQQTPPPSRAPRFSRRMVRSLPRAALEIQSQIAQKHPAAHRAHARRCFRRFLCRTRRRPTFPPRQRRPRSRLDHVPQSLPQRPPLLTRHGPPRDSRPRTPPSPSGSRRPRRIADETNLAPPSVEVIHSRSHRASPPMRNRENVFIAF